MLQDTAFEEKFNKKKIFSTFSSQQKTDLFQIGIFFSHKEYVDSALVLLEKKLQEKANLLKIDADELIKTKNAKSHKILSTVLKGFAEEMQFTYQKIEQVLQAGDFLKLLTHHVMMKDIGAGPYHGEWSHWLQWYLLYNNNILKLQNTLSDLLTLIGTSKYGVSIWNTLFDENDSINQNSFFRSPENIVRYLIGEDAQKQFPLLSALIRKRKLKREGIYTPNYTVFSADYDSDAEYDNVFHDFNSFSDEDEMPTLMFTDENDEVIKFEDSSSDEDEMHTLVFTDENDEVIEFEKHVRDTDSVSDNETVETKDFLGKVSTFNL